jgi:hypothetical protein
MAIVVVLTYGVIFYCNFIFNLYLLTFVVNRTGKNKLQLKRWFSTIIVDEPKL